MDPTREIGNRRFIELNAEELEIHRAKAAGYSGSDNPDTWANFREAEAWGSSPLLGCLIRLGDKYRRAQNVYRNPDNERVGESFKETMMDLSNYAKIAICLWEEEEAVRVGERFSEIAFALEEPESSREEYARIEASERALNSRGGR